MVGGILSMIKLADIPDVTVETDIRSTDFAKIKIGKTRYDIWAGWQPWVRFLAQLATSEQKYTSGKVLKRKTEEIAFKFFRTKLQPGLAIPLDIYIGSTVIGKPIKFDLETLKRESLGRFVPMAVQTLREAMIEEGFIGIPKALPEFAGIGSFMSNDENEFDYIEIGQDEFKFICSPTHELLKDGKDVVNFNDLNKYPFVWREKGSGMRNTFKQQFPDYKKLNKKLEINDNDSIISTVSESNYISIMSEMMADKAESAGLIKYLKVKDYQSIAKRPLYFIKLKDKGLSKLKERFWNKIKSKFIAK